MARLSDADLAKIKRDVPLDALVRAKGITLKKHGADLVGLCPFHDDKTPSLVISPAKNLWHCLGACQSGGSVIDWVMKAEGISFRHAVTLLQKDFSTLVASVVRSAVEPVAPGQPVKKSTVPRLPCDLRANADNRQLARDVIDYYHRALLDNPDALDYLRKRGLNHPDLIQTFKLGYADRTLGYRLPQTNRKAGAELRGRLQHLGFWRESGHEHFNGSLVVPIVDEAGNVLEVYGRKIGTRLREGTPLHVYLPGPHRGVWNIAALQSCNEIILCEALIDAMTFWCAGYRNVTASYGIEGFTADHWAAFKQHRIERVLIAYDGDDAGNRAAEKLAAQLGARGIDGYRIHFPPSLDANAYALQHRPASDSLGQLIRQAVWMDDGCGKAVPLLSNKEIQSHEPPPTVLAADLAPTAPAQPVVSPLPPSVAPASAHIGADVAVSEHDVTLTRGDRCYRVRGLAKNLCYDQLKVTVRVSRDSYYHIDHLDLCVARSRAAFVSQTAKELGVQEELIQRDVGYLLQQLEAVQDEHIRRASEPKTPKAVDINPEDERAALELLRDPLLLQRILNDFNVCGVVGEETNKLVGYLAAVSRQLDEPLAVMIQSSSAAGKSALMDAVLAFMPEEQRIKYSAMTGQSLYYLGETDLKHKILAIAEEEGASQAAYALKLLQSEGELTIASTGKDPQSGELVTKDYHVQGPVMLFLTTTAIDIDPELMNRCLVLGVNEDREQTRAIHVQQRYSQTLEGQLAKKDKPKLLDLHRNAQRLLKPLLVVNPYAHHLTFLDDKTRTRRDHKKYLTLIRAVTLLHQYQREIKTREHRGEWVRYIEVTAADIETANRLAHDILGRTLDELPPQTRNLLSKLYDWVTQRCAEQAAKQNDFRFSRKDVRAVTGWGDTQLKIHLARLVELEHLLAHRTARGFIYELLYDGHGQDGKPFVNGLLEVTELLDTSAAHAYDANRSGVNDPWAGIGREPVGGESGHGRASENTSECSNGGVNGHHPADAMENTLLTKNDFIASYPSALAARLPEVSCPC